MIAADGPDCLGLFDTKSRTNMLHSECDRTVLSAAFALETRTRNWQHNIAGTLRHRWVTPDSERGQSELQEKETLFLFFNQKFLVSQREKCI